MDDELRCAQCGTPARGRRFCTTCGALIAGSVVGVGPATVAPAEEASESDVHESASGTATATSVLPAPQPPTGDPAPPWLSEQSVEAVVRTRPNILAMVVLAALALSTWAIVRGVEEHTLSGTVLLVDSMYFGSSPGSSCTGRGGYGDLGGGAQVVLADERGKTLSTGRLSTGEFDGLGCVFSFVLEDVTRSDFYALTVAGGSRGQLQYSYKELAGSDWSLQLSIGDD
jgi:hypothetical protein